MSEKLSELTHVKTKDLPILLRELAKVMAAMRKVWGRQMNIGPFAHCEADLERSASRIEALERENAELRARVGALEAAERSENELNEREMKRENRRIQNEHDVARILHRRERDTPPEVTP